MPRVVKITKAEILEKAYEMTRTEGFEAVTTRKLARELGCSTQPIFSAYANMEELKEDLYERTRIEFTDYMMNHTCSNAPPFLQMGLNYITLASKEKHLFKLLCMSDSVRISSLEDMVKVAQYNIVGEGVEEATMLSEEMAKRIFLKCWLFSHGIASMVATNQISLSEEELISLLQETYLAFLK